jgi:hypothetical protein
MPRRQCQYQSQPKGAGARGGLGCVWGFPARRSRSRSHSHRARARARARAPLLAPCSLLLFLDRPCRTVGPSAWAPGSKANRPLRWTRAPGSKKSGPPLGSGSWVGPKPIGLLLGLGLPGPTPIGPARTRGWTRAPGPSPSRSGSWFGPGGGGGGGVTKNSWALTSLDLATFQASLLRSGGDMLSAFQLVGLVVKSPVR